MPYINYGEIFENKMWKLVYIFVYKNDRVRFSVQKTWSAVDSASYYCLLLIAVFLKSFHYFTILN